MKPESLDRRRRALAARVGYRTLAAGGALALVAIPLVMPAPAVAQTAYTPGNATASAQPINVALVYQGLDLGISVAPTLATFYDNSAAAEGAMLGSGMIDAMESLGGGGCATPTDEGSEDEEDSSSPLAPVTVTSDTGDGKTVSASKGGYGPFKAGNVDVSATPGAKATSSATGLGLDLGIVSIAAGTSRSEAISDPKTRTRTLSATSKVAEISLGGGLVTLDGLKWHVEQVVAGYDSRDAKEKHSATFTPGGVDAEKTGDDKSSGSLLDKIHKDAEKRRQEMRERLGSDSKIAAALDKLREADDAPADPQELADRLNPVLKYLGLKIVPPVTEKTGYGYRVTPLTIVIGGKSAVYAPLAKAIADSDALAKAQEIIFGSLGKAETCEQMEGLLASAGPLDSFRETLATAGPLLTSALLSALSGEGSIQLRLGGAQTSVDATYFPPPFGGGWDGGNVAGGLPPGVGTDVPPDAVSEAEDALEAAEAGGLGGSDAQGAGGNAGSDAGPTDVAMTPVGNLVCQTTSPSGRGGCISDRARLGVLGLVAVVALLYAGDELFRRRRILKSLAQRSR